MNRTPKSSPENTNRSKSQQVLNLALARQMLPLVRSIVQNIVETHKQLNDLAQEQDELDRNRRQLDWQRRQRRYSIAEELQSAEKNLNGAVRELSELGVALVDPGSGIVDFPTRINGRSAAFSWQHGEDDVLHWHYLDESVRRVIPSDWATGVPLRA
jgi:hypothetical protein